MRMGSQIIAPEGFHCLSKDVTYHFLNSNGNINRVRLVLFSDDGKMLGANLITLTRIEFEDALEHGLLMENGTVDKFPPWLSGIKGVSIRQLESRRHSAKETYDQKVNKRFAAISDLVIRRDEILSCDDPDAFINAHAKSMRPVQNTVRLRLWFYTYIIFGHNKWALMPPLHRIGGWNRLDPARKNKLGRPSRKGKRYGYHSDAEMREKIIKGFTEYKSITKTWDEVYGDVVTKTFGCKSFYSNGSMQFQHPEGKAFPTFSQYRSHVKRYFSPRDLLHELKGQHKAKLKLGTAGSFADSITNIYQRVEFDGYYISEKLSGVIEGSAIEGFCVVRAVCGLSGAILGIGFAETKENMDAYNMALFCMAIGKVKYCELFGVDIEPWEWPGDGLSGGIIFDRGPAACYPSKPHINWLKAHELTPSYSGQSKATAESSHPRDKKLLGQPSHKHSKFNFVEMSRREIVQAIEDNRSSDASHRMNDNMYQDGVKPTPLGIFNYHDGIGRNSCISMEFDTAVRTFLKACPACIRRDAVYLYGRKYRSPELEACGVFDLVARNGVINVSAFVLTMCVRHIWIEVNGVLYELDFVRPASAHSGMADISLRDLQDIDQLRRDANAEHREEKPAIQQFYGQKIKSLTEKERDAGERKLGSPPKNGAAERDTVDYKRFQGVTK